MRAFCLVLLVATLMGQHAVAQEWLEGNFASSEGICTGAAAVIGDGGTEFSLAGGFAADESDCEILSVMPSTRRDAVVLFALCIYAGMNQAETFVVSPAGEGAITITSDGRAPEGYGMVPEGTADFVRCD